MHVLIQSLMLFFKSLMMTLWGRLTPASLFPHFTAFTAGNALKVLSEFLSSLRNKSRTWWRMSEYPTSEPVHSGYLQMTGSIFKHMLIKSEYSWKTHTQWKTCQLSLPAKKKEKKKRTKASSSAVQPHQSLLEKTWACGSPLQGSRRAVRPQAFLFTWHIYTLFCSLKAPQTSRVSTSLPSTTARLLMSNNMSLTDLKN